MFYRLDCRRGKNFYNLCKLIENKLFFEIFELIYLRIVSTTYRLLFNYSRKHVTDSCDQRKRWSFQFLAFQKSLIFCPGKLVLNKYMENLLKELKLELTIKFSFSDVISKLRIKASAASKNLSPA